MTIFPTKNLLPVNAKMKIIAVLILLAIFFLLNHGNGPTHLKIQRGSSLQMPAQSLQKTKYLHGNHFFNLTPFFLGVFCIVQVSSCLLYFLIILNFRFQNLSPAQKIASTILNNQKFISSFLKIAKLKRFDQQYNLYSKQSTRPFPIPVEIHSDSSFFPQLLRHLKVACLSENYLYLSTHQIMDMKMLDWLNKVSNNKIFEMAHKVVNKQWPEENLLWFNSETYHKLEAWIANQLERTILKHFYSKSKKDNPIIQMLQYFKRKNKNQEYSYLDMTLEIYEKKSEGQIKSIKDKLKDEEERYLEEKRDEIFMIIDTEQKKKKKKKKEKKRSEKNEKADLQTHPFDETLNQKQQQSLKISKFIAFEVEQNMVQEKQSQKMEKELSIEKQAKEKSIETKKKKIKNRDSSLSKSKVSSRNLIYVSPKRALSPTQKKSIFLESFEHEEKETNEKYSDDCKANVSKTQDQKSSENPLSQDMSCEQNQSSEFALCKNEIKNRKRKRRRCNKEIQLYKELRKNIMKKIVNKQLNNTIDNLSIETNNMYQMKIISFQRVRVFVQSLFPTANALLFGSNAIGLSLPNSDVDIMLLNLPCCDKDEASQILAQIAVQINAMGWVVSCSTYLNAKVPLVKLEIDPSIHYLNTKRKNDQFAVYNPMALYFLELQSKENLATIKVDITISIEGVNSTGYESTFLMKEWIGRYPIIQRILLIFKFILSIKGYNQNFKGGIGSYCLFVMIAAYVKETNYTEDMDDGEIFLQILKFYGEQFDNLVKIVSLKQEGTCFCQSNRANPSEEGKVSLLKILDPITGRIMSSSCNEYNNIKQQFRRIRQQILDIEDLVQQQLLETPRNTQQINKLFQNKKAIDKWINKFETKANVSIRNIIQGKK